MNAPGGAQRPRAGGLRAAGRLAAALLAGLLALAACAEDENVLVKQVDCPPPAAQVGAVCGGAIVVSLDYAASGDGLGVHPQDFAPIAWGPGVATPNAADDVDGRNNTGTFDAAFPASWACQELADFGRTDWYLPATGEVVAIFDARASVPGLQPAQYWTSREFDSVNARTVDMTTGLPGQRFKVVGQPFRCVRRLKIPPVAP